MANVPAVQEAESEFHDRLIDPAEILQILRRRWRPILFVAAAVLLLAAFLYSTADRKYVATAHLAFEQRMEEVVNVGAEKPVTTSSSAIDTEVEILKSPDTAAAVVDKLNLTNTPGFGIAPGWPAGARGSRERAISVVRSGLDIARQGTSFTVAVSFTYDDPVTAARVANAVADIHANSQKTTTYAERVQEIRMIANRLGILRAEAIRADQAVARQRGATNLIDLASDSSSAAATMQALNTQLAQARADEAAASARAAAAANAATVEAPAVNSLRAEQARLRARQAELSRRYDSSYPTLVALNEQLSSIDRALNSEIARVRQGAIAEAQAARNRAASLLGSINRQQGQLLAANSSSAQLAELQRNSAAANSLYQALLDQYKEKMVALGTERSNANVIARATPPGSPATPNPSAYLIGGIVAALVLGAFVALALETREAGILSQAAAEEKLGLPVLASIPDIATVKDTPLRGGTPRTIADHMVEHSTGVFAEAFRSIRMAMKIGQDGQVARVLAVTSALRDEGKTTSSICLARSAALAGLRVLLVDCDLRHRSTTETLAPDSKVGLMEILNEQARLEDAVLVDDASGAHILPVGGPEWESSELLVSRPMRAALAGLRGTYDLIILETAPVLPVAETRAIAAMADATLLLVRWRKTPVDVIRKSISHLNRAGATLIGTVLCRVSLHSSIASSMGEEVYYYPSARPKAA